MSNMVAARCVANASGGGQSEMIIVRYYSSLSMQQELPNMQILSLYRIAGNF